jgi:hypothetical protein
VATNHQRTLEHVRSPPFTIGLILLVAAMMLPAFLNWAEPGFSRSTGRWLGAMAAVVFAGAAGATLMARGLRQPLWAAASCGGLATLGGNLALYFWSSWRSSLWNYEVALVVIVGAIPAMIVFRLLTRAADPA